MLSERKFLFKNVTKQCQRLANGLIAEEIIAIALEHEK